MKKSGALIARASKLFALPPHRLWAIRRFSTTPSRFLGHSKVFSPPLRSSSVRLELVMRCAKALTISKIKGLATITHLDDVVGIDPVLGICLGATVAVVIDMLALTTSTRFHLIAPSLELRRVIDRVTIAGCARWDGWWPDGAGIDSADRWCERTKLGHQD